MHEPAAINLLSFRWSMRRGKAQADHRRCEVKRLCIWQPTLLKELSLHWGRFLNMATSPKECRVTPRLARRLRALRLVHLQSGSRNWRELGRASPMTLSGRRPFGKTAPILLSAVQANSGLTFAHC
jgi:hypothetical protein